jgi:hypothetical protein
VLPSINHTKQVTQLNLVPYTNDGLELVIDTQTGESFASISAVARLTDKSKQSVSDYVNGELKGVRQMTLKNAEIQTPGGLQGVKLLNENQILEVVSKYNPSLLIKFAQCGLRVFLHQLAGFEVNSTAVEQHSVRQLPVHTAVEYSNAAALIRQENNKTLQELLRNQLIDELSVLQGQSNSIASAKPSYTIAKVRARELGYTTIEIGHGGDLGKWLAKSVPVAFRERVGKYEVNHYEVTSQLDTAIHTFFSLKKTLK